MSIGCDALFCLFILLAIYDVGLSPNTNQTSSMLTPSFGSPGQSTPIPRRAFCRAGAWTVSLAGFTMRIIPAGKDKFVARRSSAGYPDSISMLKMDSEYFKASSVCVCDITMTRPFFKSLTIDQKSSFCLGDNILGLSPTFTVCAVMPPDWFVLDMLILVSVIVGFGVGGMTSASVTATGSHLFQLDRATKIVDITTTRHTNRIKALGAEMYCSTTLLSNAETKPEKATVPTICQTSMNP